MFEESSSVRSKDVALCGECANNAMFAECERMARNREDKTFHRWWISRGGQQRGWCSKVGGSGGEGEELGRTIHCDRIMVGSTSTVGNKLFPLGWAAYMVRAGKRIKDQARSIDQGLINREANLA